MCVCFLKVSLWFWSTINSDLGLRRDVSSLIDLWHHHTEDFFAAVSMWLTRTSFPQSGPCWVGGTSHTLLRKTVRNIQSPYQRLVSWCSQLSWQLIEKLKVHPDTQMIDCQILAGGGSSFGNRSLAPPHLMLNILVFKKPAATVGCRSFLGGFFVLNCHATAIHQYVACAGLSLHRFTGSDEIMWIQELGKSSRVKSILFIYRASNRSWLRADFIWSRSRLSSLQLHLHWSWTRLRAGEAIWRY